MEVRTARLRSLAKVNLDLRVLHKRADGYHELRTVFQSISLSDTIGVSYSAGPKTSIQMAGNVEIPGNLIEKAAEAILNVSKSKGLIQFNLKKVIPIGGGLGGGSSNAASVLLALPVLLGKSVPLVKLEEIAANLGSDVTFFLHGGTALGLGRGTELYPLQEIRTRRGLLVEPGVHVSTGQAYEDLARKSVEISAPADFQQFLWKLDSGTFGIGVNDFEAVVYKNYPKLRSIHRLLGGAGASYVRMSGSGSSIYAFFDGNGPDPGILEGYTVHPIATVSRRQYQKIWRRQLRAHIAPGEKWPPQSRYAQ